MKTPNARAYSYLRFSHPEQAKGDSYRRQIDLRDAWLARNNATLDTSLSLEDKGVSAFCGDHRDNADRRALAAFEALVKRGNIPRGSYLIVENLDRLSREHIIPALSLLLDLIQAGIRVVQLVPVETVYDAKSNPMHLMMAIMELSRGHSESAMKSERVGSAWQQKKRRAAETGEVMTTQVPAWLRVVDGEWEVVAAAAATIRRIFRMAIDGYGLGVITRKLNANQVPVFGRARHWARSYVGKLLTNRAVVGEYQPHTARADELNPRRERRPDGKPIAGYFPAIIDEETWYAARAAMTGRRGKAGRPAKEGVNVFAGLLHDAWGGGTLQRLDKGKKASGPILVPYDTLQGVAGARRKSFPYGTFVEAVLTCLREIDPSEVVQPRDGGPDETLALAGRLAEVEAQIEKVKVRLQASYSDAVADVLERHEATRATIAEQLAAARRAAASPLDAAWGECRTLLSALKAAPDAEDARVRLRAALRRVAEGFWCLFVARGSVRVAAVQAWFAGGAHRDYLIVHKAGTGGAVGNRPSQWWVRSLASVAPADLDLRRREDARALEAALAAVDLTAGPDDEPKATRPVKKRPAKRAAPKPGRLRTRPPASRKG